ncbi:transposase [Georgenia sp. TF02-10]|uniref:NF041680 family putative transposase n=1 Tax=Georgenia sp. TF02-10 TaxID=2917725 RepID=UPI001FA7C69B|nr:NF041680 family putative transposase [Georgenia sp. TF02-10]UNX53464.1 transposase [Georgenia sp. TF02-10]UNX53627.1 transposase [Georgenia sp. TF02-10]UNX55643.1 transposase [Georgenia sp. TF02-10]
MVHDDRSLSVPGGAGLVGFREGFYQAWTGWADAAFELTEAVLCTPGPVTSVPALSLEPVFRRSHGSLYKALARGRVDAGAVRDLLAAHRPGGWPLVFAMDATTWPRCDAETSPGRGFYYSASTHSAGQPIVAGWSYQHLVQLSWAKDSWTAPVDVVRLDPTADATTVTAAQVTGLVARLGATEQVPVVAFDAGYDAPGLTHALAGVRAGIVVRIRDDRVFYADPEPAPAGRAGRPRRHGARRALREVASWPTPDHSITATDDRYGTVRVDAWHDLHPKLGRRGPWKDSDVVPIVRGTIMRVDVEHLPKPTSRTKKVLWLWVTGPHGTDLDVCWRAYLRRFDIEHTFRFYKNTLGWTAPSLRTPEQADRWTWIITAAYTQLRLARTLVEDCRRPWERPRPRPKLSPARVRRGFRQLQPHLPPMARAPKSRTPGPGRPPGTRTGPRTRHPAIKKAA